MSFKSSLAKGDIGEMLYFEANCNQVSKEDGRKRDFTFTATGEGIELKTDYYPMAKTQNFFFERFSDRDRQTPGGPWQSLANGTPHFVYFFVKDLTYFSFDTKQLVEALEPIVQTLDVVEVQNKTWVTEGYRVPRDTLTDLYKQTRLTVSIRND